MDDNQLESRALYCMVIKKEMLSQTKLRRFWYRGCCRLGIRDDWGRQMPPQSLISFDGPAWSS